MARLLLRDLTPGTNYKIQLRAVEDDSFSDWSRLFDLPTTADVTPPDTPAWAASDPWVVNGDTFVATWEPVDSNLEHNKDLSHYEIEFGDGTSFTVLRTNNTSYTLTYDHNRILFGTPRATVTARVRAVDGVGNGSPWTSLETATNPAPAPVSSVTVTSLYDAIDVKWEPGTLPDDFKSFVLQYSTTSASGGFTTIYEGPNSQFTFATTMFLTDHWFRVYVRDKFNTLSTAVTSGSVRPKSTFSTDSTPPEAPASVTATAGYDSARQESYIDASWVASVSADTAEYEVRYSTNATNWSYTKVGADSTGVRLDNINPGQQYYISVRSIDAGMNKSGWTNASTYPISSIADTTAPSAPAAPTAAVGTQKLQVVVSGNKAAGGAMESDVAYYEVFASTTNNFTTYNSTTMLGTIQKGPAMVETFQIPASAGSGTSQTWYVRVRAVDRSGNVSPASAQATAAVGLILTANIGDAQITNAKIADLSVDKLTAGTGIATDFTIKSTLTLGEAGNDGVIRSYDYGTSGGATGFSLDSDGLVIKTGQVEAQALRIQTGANIMAPRQSSWEGVASSYTNGNGYYKDSGGIIEGVNTSGGKFGAQKFGAIWGPSPSPIRIYLANSTTDYNVPTEAGKTYIFSLYAWAGYAQSCTFSVKWSNGTIELLDTETLSGIDNAPAATRLVGVKTAPAGTTGCVLIWENPNTGVSGGISLDGIQVEEKLTASDEPSSWRAPGYTAIDGSLIRTGAIQSTADAIDANGNTIPDLKAWSINTTGQAVFGDMLIRGSIVMGVDGAEPPVSGNGDEEDLTGVSIMKSYNYIPGTQGWAVKSNGNAEFLQLAADSISADAISAVSPDKLRPGTMTADLIIGSSIRAGTTTTIWVTHKQRESDVAYLTASAPDGSYHNRRVGERIQVEMFQNGVVDTSFDVTGNDYAIIDYVDATHIGYINPGPDVPLTEHEGDIIAEGRSVTMTPEGLTLLSDDGISPMVVLPTTRDESPYFAGAVEANSLTVIDEFLLQGDTNNLAPGGVFTLNAALGAPAGSINVGVGTNSYPTWLDNELSTARRGLYYSNSVPGHVACYITTNDFFGGHTQAMTQNGDFVFNEYMESDIFGGGNFGVVNIGSDWYALRLMDHNASNSYNSFWVCKYSNTPYGPMVSRWQYDEHVHSYFNTTLAQWQVHDTNGSLLKEPGFGTDGTNIYIVRPNKTGELIVSWYNVAGTRLGITKTDIKDNQNMRGIMVGSFDFGSDRWVISTQGNSSVYGRNYVTMPNGSRTNETWFTARNVQIGTAWNGTNFVTLNDNRTITTHPSLAKAGATRWYAKASWYKPGTTVNVSSYNGNGAVTSVITATPHDYEVNQQVYLNLVEPLVGYFTIATAPSNTTFTVSSGYSGSGTGGTVTDEWESGLSGVTTVDVTRRADLTLSTGSSIPKGGGVVPDRARFYLSTSSTGPFYRQDNPNPSNTQTFLVTPTFSGTTTTARAFPGGTPAKIVSSNGKLEISSDGFMRTDRLILQSTRDATPNAGNEPALMVGNPTGYHLRIDGNEIISMSNDNTNSQLVLNNVTGGETRVYDLLSQSMTAAGGLAVNGAARLGFNSHYISKFRFGMVSVSLNGNGVANVPHGMGVVPESVILTGFNNNLIWDVSAISATAFNVRAIQHNGTYLADGSTRNVFWLALA